MALIMNVWLASLSSSGSVYSAGVMLLAYQSRKHKDMIPCRASCNAIPRPISTGRGTGDSANVLGCIQYIFHNTERLRIKYGLDRSSSTTTTIATLSLSDVQDLVPTQGQSLLTGVFRRACDILRRVAGKRQKNTSVVRRTEWAVRDRERFKEFVNELRGYNDSLERLFPGAIFQAVRPDIEQSVGLEELQLLQEATAEEHHEM